MAFLAFSAVFAAVVYLHFAFAQSAWRALRGREPREVNLAYVRLEDYFGRSFRSKLARWRTLPDTGEPNPYFRTIWKGDERILLAGTTHYPEAGTSDEILSFDGEFSCGPRCTFTREIHVRRDCQIGKQSRLQSIASDGALTLGPDVTVVRWADSTGDLELRPGARVLARATSEGTIRMGLDSRAVSLFAPEVASHGRADEDVEIHAAPRPGSGITLLAPGESGEPLGIFNSGVDRGRFTPLGRDGWIYRGDLILGVPLRLQAKLVVMGTLVCPGGSLLEADVKATGDISLGPATVTHGHLIADGDLYLGPRSFFSGVLLAGGNLHIGRTTRGLADPDPAIAYAGNVVRLESNVVIQGKVSAGKHVVAVADRE
jgi:hypothetical protein